MSLGSSRCRSVALATTALVTAALLSVPSGPSAAATDVWGPEEDLGAHLDLYNQDRDVALVMVGSGGSAVAAWAEGDYVTPGPLTAARRATTGGWTAPVPLSADLTGDATYDLATGPHGAASVVWERLVGTTWRIEESHLVGGTWSPPVDLGRGRWPDTVVDGNGATTVAWSRHGVHIARRPHDGTWKTSHRVVRGMASEVGLAANRRGDLALMWTARYHGVRASVRPQGRTWSAPVTLDQGPYVTSTRVAIDHRGRALTAWTVTGVWNERQHEYYNYLASARSDARGHWSRTRVVTRRLGEDGGWSDLSMNARGQALVGWLQRYRSDSPAQLWAARFRPDGTWTAPARVATTARSQPHVLLDDAGVAHIVTNRSRASYFSQRPGAGWRVEVLNLGRVLDAQGTGDRMVMLFYRRTLRSRTLDIR